MSVRAGGIALVRHLVAIAVLPFTVAVLVPMWIAQSYALVGRLLPRVRPWQGPGS